MKVLLDECLPRKLKQELAGHEVATVPEMQWAGTKNGALLQLAAPDFHAFVTIDQNLQYQQNLSTANIAIILLVAPDNRLETLRPLMPDVQVALQTIRPGDLIRVQFSSPP